MNEIKAVAFRSAVSGYNKKDVNDYIAHLGENLAGCMKERDDLALQLSALGAQLDEVLAKNAALCAELEAKSSAGSDEIERANSVISAQNEALAKLRAENEALREKSDAADAKLAQVQDKLEAYDEMEDKLAEYERMSAKMGKLYIEAASGAEKIRSDADSYAEKLRADTEAECEKMLDAASERLKELSERGYDRLTRVIRDATEEINESAKKLRTRIDAIRLDDEDEDDDELFESSSELDLSHDLSEMLANAIGEGFKK